MKATEIKAGDELRMSGVLIGGYIAATVTSVDNGILTAEVAVGKTVQQAPLTALQTMIDAGNLTVIAK